MAIVFFSESAVAGSVSSANGTLLEYRTSLQARPVLEALINHAKLGLIVHSRNQPREALEEAMKRSGLLSFFDSELVIFNDGLTRDGLINAREMILPEAAFFVDEDCSQRSLALELGFSMAIPHPLLVLEVLDGGKLLYVRASKIKSERLLSSLTELAIVPFHVTTDHHGSAYLIATSRTAEKLRATGLEVKVFGEEHDPQITDCYLARDDRPVQEGVSREKHASDFLATQDKARFIVDAVDDSLLLALPAEVGVEEIHFPIAKHGHNRRLLVNRRLVPSFKGAFYQMQTPTPSNIASSFELSDLEIKALQGITAKSIEQIHSCYIGDKPLPSSGGFVESRHISHPHNEVVTEALCRHLDEIGQGQMTQAKRYNFYFKGKLLSNVIADLPGTINNSWVIVSAHFDSTARNDGVDNPAPGADDDASGMAGVLSTADVAVKLRRAGQHFKHGLRFIFFNAEEDYIFGSQEYVRELESDVNIVGVFQMDMIGYTGGTPQRDFEVHAGCGGNLKAETKSLDLARTIERVRSQVTTALNPPQIYPSFKGGSDPSFGHSDHTPFQKQGYAACMISEDYNDGPLITSPPPRANGDYHRRTDKKIDCKYTAEIVRVVAAAAISTAKG